MHAHLLDLTSELGLTKFSQYSGGISFFQTKSFEPPQKFFVPPAEKPSYRIAGGTQKIIDALVEKLDKEQIHLNKKVSGIRETEHNTLSIEIADGTIMTADRIVICIPPQLAAAGIQFTPTLPRNVIEILPNVQTWMAGALKFTLEYAEPFWRNEGYSGMLYSHAGLVVEMYDHTNFEESKFGFTGFLSSGASRFSQDVRKEYVLKQLSELFGSKILHPKTYVDKLWNDQFLISGDQIIQRPHQHNGDSSLQQTYFNDKLIFGGTESSLLFSGYMEGAVIAAKSVLNKLLLV